MQGCLHGCDLEMESESENGVLDMGYPGILIHYVTCWMLVITS